MPKKVSITEDGLAKVRAIRNAPEEFDLKRDLAPFLRHRSNHVIAAAASVVQQTESSQLIPELSAAFLELLPNAPARDEGCKALTAIAEALVTMGEDADAVYEKGVSYVQKEGSFGPPVDTASTLRGLCCRGLVRMRHPLAMYSAVNLLADPQVPARVGAVGALSDSNSREAELLLRLTVLKGDDAEVMGACFAALLAISSSRSLEFVAKHLNSSKEATVEAAALALGEARISTALAPLQDAWSQHRRPALRRVILLSIAMLRQDDAVDYLINRLKQDPEVAALDALEALAIYRTNEATRRRVKEVAASRTLPKLSQVIAREWCD